MQADRNYSFPFFAPLPIGFVCFAALLIYQVIAGPFLLPSDKSGLLRKARDELREYIAEVYVSEHSSSVGKSVEFMMNSLGIAPSFAVKIRRRSDNNSADSSLEVESQDDGSKIKTPKFLIDSKYFKNFSEFWGSSKNIPERLGSTDNLTELNIESHSTGENDYFDIISPSFHELIRAGDVVFIASAQDAVEKMMKSILGESKGLYILQGNVMSLPGYGSELVELVVSDSNPFLGKKVSDFSVEFGEKYKSGILTLRPKDFGKLNPSDNESVNDFDQGNNIELTDQSEEELMVAKAQDLHRNIVISNHELSYGDTILVVTNKNNVEELTHNRDFFIVSTVGNLPKPLNFYSLIPVFVFVVMLILVASDLIEMCPAALAVTAFFFIGGWIKASRSLCCQAGLVRSTPRIPTTRGTSIPTMVTRTTTIRTTTTTPWRLAPENDALCCFLLKTCIGSISIAGVINAIL
jgi:hypothetical protein